MDNDTQETLDALEYFTAERMRSLQSKLTKTANAIENDALIYHLSKLLSQEDQATLRQAVTILRSIKIKVEHAKEIKKREEDRRQVQWERLQRSIDTQCQTLFPDPQTHADARQLLLWRLAMGDYWRNYFPDDDAYCPKNRFVAGELADWEQARFRDDVAGNHILGAARHWRRDLIKCLKDMNTWWTDDPTQAPEAELTARFNEQWASLIESQYADLLKRFDAEVAIIGNEKVTRLR